MTAPNVFTIPPHRAFADALAAGLIARFGKEKTSLAHGIVLVPNNRAARAVQDAFVRRSGGGLLLPRLVPVGDPELDERIGGMLEPLGEGEAPIPPATEPARRLMLSPVGSSISDPTRRAFGSTEISRTLVHC